MKIYFSPASPYVRKCMIVAYELGLTGRIERLACAAHPVIRDRTIVASNPLGKVPTLLTDDGVVLYDSRVICEYLDALDGQNRMFPAGNAARWKALTDQALGDGLLDAALLARYEMILRPESIRFQPWFDGQMDKIRSCLDVIEEQATKYDERFDIGAVTIACALGYLDFRFPDFDWRRAHPSAAVWFARASVRRSLQETMPQG